MHAPRCRRGAQNYKKRAKSALKYLRRTKILYILQAYENARTDSNSAADRIKLYFRPFHALKINHTGRAQICAAQAKKDI